MNIKHCNLCAYKNGVFSAIGYTMRFKLIIINVIKELKSIISLLFYFKLGLKSGGYTFRGCKMLIILNSKGGQLQRT